MCVKQVSGLHQANLPVPLAISKEKQTAEQLSISQDDLKHCLVDLENAEDYTKFFFTWKERSGQRRP